jgi:DNA-binding XRE family transcriptional regulator
MLAIDLFQPFQPIGHAASDGTLYRTAWAAWLHDILEPKWAAILPTLTDRQEVRSTREQLRISQTELAHRADISQCYLAQLESGDKRISDVLAEKLWVALWRVYQESKHVPPALQLLVRLEGDLAVITERREERL